MLDRFGSIAADLAESRAMLEKVSALVKQSEAVTA